jgi:hypothetical protein
MLGLRHFKSQPKCVKEPHVCYDHNCIHKSTIKKYFFLEISKHHINEKKIIYKPLLHNLTTTNTFELLEALIINIKKIDMCVLKGIHY